MECKWYEFMTLYTMSDMCANNKIVLTCKMTLVYHEIAYVWRVMQGLRHYNYDTVPCLHSVGSFNLYWNLKGVHSYAFKNYFRDMDETLVEFNKYNKQ